jgi:PAS domain S-box-containing protein
MVIVNGSGEIVLINSQAEKLFGYSREELLGSRIERLMRPAGSAGERRECPFHHHGCFPPAVPHLPM